MFLFGELRKNRRAFLKEKRETSLDLPLILLQNSRERTRKRRNNMKYIKQFFIILLISFLGEALHALLPLPIPASIYGIMLLFAALALKIIPVSAVKDVSTFLLEIMPMLFIPAAAGLLEAWGILKPNLAAYIVITLVATVAVMAVSGLVTQFFVRKGKKNG